MTIYHFPKSFLNPNPFHISVRSKKPSLSVLEKLTARKKDFPWIETSGSAGYQMYRCSACAKAGKGVWVSFRNFETDKTQKSQFKTPDSETKHVAVVQLIATRDNNDTFWRKQAEEAKAKETARKSKFLQNKRDQVRSVLFLAKEEISIGKYRSLLKYASEIDGSSVEVSYHSSTKAGWSLLDSVSEVILKRDSKIVRDADMHSIILDSTNDGDDWVAVLARCVNIKGNVHIVLWDLVCMADAKHDSFVNTLLGLYQRDEVDLRKVVGWASVCCATMKKAAKEFQAQANVNLIFCHCLAHRIDLSLSADMWKSSDLCKDVEEALRAAYTMFNRSTQRRKELQTLVREFGKVKVPAALIDIRWLSKLQCLELFASEATAAALREYINAKPPDHLSAGEQAVFSILDGRMEELTDLLKILRPVGALTGRLQKRTLHLPGALSLLNQSKEELTAIGGLTKEVAGLRDDLIYYLSKRIPVEETSWLGFLKLGAAYPDDVVIFKFGLLQARLAHLDWQCTPQEFLEDYKKARRTVRELIENGSNARDLNMDAIAADLDMGRAWDMYRAVTRCISPTSAEAERTFSCLSRLRSKSRRNLHVHLEAYVRVSQAKTLGAGIEGDAFIDEVVVSWDRAKPRRNRPMGLATGPHAKKARLLGPAAVQGEDEQCDDTTSDERWVRNR